MFKSKEKNTAIEDQMISTVINEGYLIEGNVKGNAVIRIDGMIKGNVESESGIVLGEKGEIDGDLRSKSIIVYGKITGNIDTECLEIKKTGIIQGDITTAKLEVEMGGVYNGKLQMSATQMAKD